MRGSPATPARFSVPVLVVAFAAQLLVPQVAFAQRPPPVIPQLELPQLTGVWYEIATTGSWWHRRCVSDTRYRFEPLKGRDLRASSICTTARRVEEHRGRLRAAGNGDGRLSIRFAPGIFGWLPVTWADFWIIAAGEDFGWLLIGDDSLERLSILSRTVALDEAAIARAVAVARRQGYDVERLAPMPHPSGPSGLEPPKD